MKTSAILSHLSPGCLAPIVLRKNKQRKREADEDLLFKKNIKVFLFSLLFYRVSTNYPSSVVGATFSDVKSISIVYDVQISLHPYHITFQPPCFVLLAGGFVLVPDSRWAFYICVFVSSFSNVILGIASLPLSLSLQRLRE